MPGVKGQSGRRRTPTADLVRRGDPRGKKRLKTEPMPVEGLPPKPESLSGVALAVWDNYEKILSANKTLSKGDGMTLELLAESYAEWHENNEFLKKYGTTYIDDFGAVRQYPQTKLRSDARKDVIRLIRECGLSASSRAGVDKLPDMTKPFNRWSLNNKIT